MSRGPLALVLVVFVGAALAGCVGDNGSGDDKGDDLKVADEAVATEQTGSIKGQVLTLDLEPVVNENVALFSVLDNATVLMQTKTDLQGRFTFNGVPPGAYRVHAAPACCKTGSKALNVHAGTVAEASLLLDRVVSVIAYVVEKEWTGFIACGVGTVNACYTDPQNSKEIYPILSSGLKSVVVGLRWDSNGFTDQLDLTMDRWENPEYHYDYISAVGPSPIRAAVDDTTIDRDGAKFSTIEDELKIRFIVNAPDAQFVYQQPFTLYWNEYYHEPAPEGADPIPEG